MRAKGRPVVGAVAGLLFGVFLALNLQQFGIRPLDNVSVIGLPLVGLALGVVIGLRTPFRRRASAADTVRGRS